MEIGPFDLTEVLTLVIHLIAFFFILKAYKEGISIKSTKRFWSYFLIVASLILFNRIFTNVESLGFKPFFNVLEHASVLGAAMVLAVITAKTVKGETNA